MPALANNPAQDAPLPARNDCAVCGGTRFETIDRQTLDLVSLGRCEIVFGLCRTCGHIQQTPPVDAALMARHYAGYSNYTVFDDPARLRAAPPSRETRRLLSLARDLDLKLGRAYEVGAAHGRHLQHFHKAGWAVGGCEPSAKAAAQADSLFGVKLDVGTDADCLARQSGLDLLMIVHVLEHINDPASALRRIRDSLADDGHLFLEVPCAASPERLPPGWFAFEHLHYFTPETLLLLLDEVGFETVELRVTLDLPVGPVILVAAKKRHTPAPARDKGAARQATASFAKAYLERDTQSWLNLTAKLAKLSGEAFLWGAGVHTAQLLDRTGMARWLTLRAAADRDPQKWGGMLGTIPVISPETLLALPSRAPIIISSHFAEAEIVRTLRAAGVAEERIVPLYGHT
jgi:SAM-dependent methyltransferase